MIPLPNKIQKLQGNLNLENGFVLDLGPYENLTHLISKHLKTIGQIHEISHTAAVFSVIQDDSVQEEGYVLMIGREHVLLKVASEAGVFYGLMTLLQYVVQKPIRCVTIEDAPRHAYRGVMLDVSRHFVPVQAIKQVLDIMGYMKLNRFHWHLTDDHGWRIQLECLERIGKEAEGPFNEISSQGYYTLEEVKEIIEYASERMIQILPEIDMPGHMTGLLVHYPELACFPRDFSISTGAGIHEDVLCAGKQTTYDQMYAILTEVAEIFPYEIIHIGGDEVPKSKWIQCEHCRSYAKAHNIETPKALQTHFMQSMVKHINRLGKKVLLWNDALMEASLDGDVIGEFWMTMEKKEAIHTLEERNPIIDANFKHYYLDYPIEMIGLRKTYEYKSIFESSQLMGIESPLWTEWVSDQTIMDQRLYPRLFAVAESAWTTESNKFYVDFLLRLRALEPTLHHMGIHLPDESQYDVGLFKKASVSFKHINRMMDIKTVMTALKLKKDNEVRLLDE